MQRWRGVKLAMEKDGTCLFSRVSGVRYLAIAALSRGGVDCICDDALRVVEISRVKALFCELGLSPGENRRSLIGR
jgi:hypothetical protein